VKRPVFPKRMVIDLCVAIAAGGVAWMVLARPAAERLEAVRAEFQTQRDRIARLLDEDTADQEPGRLVSNAQREHDRLRGALADRSEEGFRARADRAGVRIAETTDSGGRQVVERRAVLEGGYDQVIGFIREIEQRMGASVVDRVEIAPTEGGGTVRATLESRHVGGPEGQARDAGGSP